jgi:hypothetical protein
MSTQHPSTLPTNVLQPTHPQNTTNPPYLPPLVPPPPPPPYPPAVTGHSARDVMSSSSRLAHDLKSLTRTPQRRAAQPQPPLRRVPTRAQLRVATRRRRRRRLQRGRRDDATLGEAGGAWERGRRARWDVLEKEPLPKLRCSPYRCSQTESAAWARTTETTEQLTVVPVVPSRRSVSTPSCSCAESTVCATSVRFSVCLACSLSSVRALVSC